MILSPQITRGNPKNDVASKRRSEPGLSDDARLRGTAVMLAAAVRSTGVTTAMTIGRTRRDIHLRKCDAYALKVLAQKKKAHALDITDAPLHRAVPRSDVIVAIPILAVQRQYFPI